MAALVAGHQRAEELAEHSMARSIQLALFGNQNDATDSVGDDDIPGVEDALAMFGLEEV